MFARMPRYGPAQPGIRSAARMRATGQHGSSRHVLALFDSSSRRINEQISGLLICGFGVQVPGDAPVLTWGLYKSQVISWCPVCHHSVPLLAPCLLGGRTVGLRQFVKNGGIGLDQSSEAFRCSYAGRQPHEPLRRPSAVHMCPGESEGADPSQTVGIAVPALCRPCTSEDFKDPETPEARTNSRRRRSLSRAQQRV
jgi:hypothetical protein